MRQSLQQKLMQKLSPQQIQLMKLLQLPTVALEARIEEEIEANPALDEGKESESDDTADNQLDGQEDYAELSESEKEFDFSDYTDDDETPDYKLYSSNHSKDDEDKSVPIGTQSTFHDRLMRQLYLRHLSERETQIAEHLIGSLDDSGYLRRDLPSISDDLAFSQNVFASVEELEKVLSVIQDLDPPGVAARDLKECLMLQLQKKQTTYATRTALEILRNHFDEFTKKHYSKILAKLEIEEEDLREAIDEILKLNPKPGNSMNETARPIEQVIPDFMIATDGDDLHVTLNGRNAPELRVSKKYSEMMEVYSKIKGKPTKAEREAMLFVKQKMDSARWFIDAIKQRQNTLLTTMQAIAEHQKEYFLTGDETKLKPMILKDIADKVGLDISTISRVSNSKYAQTPYGTFLLKSFFSESLSTDSGEEVSTREVKKILQDMIGGEDKRRPLTDDILAKDLKKRGYNIARRTVAKYREQLNIPVARLRKEI